MQCLRTKKVKKPFDNRFLHAHLKLKDRPDNEFFKKVTKTRRNGQPLLNRLMAAIVLGAYAQKTQEVFLSRKEASRILSLNGGRKTQMSGDTWKYLKETMIEIGFIVEISPPSKYGFKYRPGTPGLYRIINEGFTDQIRLEF
jgi:hypothetical protein